MMNSQILEYVDSSKTQKCKYLENETNILLANKKMINYIL